MNPTQLMLAAILAGTTGSPMHTSAQTSVAGELASLANNDYRIWRAFNNNYWPALYFVDAEGRVRHHQFGEGDYEESEKFIQQLLAEGGSRNVDRELVAVEGLGAEAAADWRSLKTPENYGGYDRTENFDFPRRCGEPQCDFG